MKHCVRNSEYGTHNSYLHESSRYLNNRSDGFHEREIEYCRDMSGSSNQQYWYRGSFKEGFSEEVKLMLKLVE